jgi:hypothetical protein
MLIFMEIASRKVFIYHITRRRTPDNILESIDEFKNYIGEINV